jgi:CheY-like chemotaxis protein
MFTILIVDDNPSFRMQAARLCEREGFATITAGNIAELMSALATSTPDLVADRSRAGVTSDCAASMTRSCLM